MKIQIILVFFFIIEYAYSSNDCSYFETQLASSCGKINQYNSTYGCKYSNGQCNDYYKTCSSYKGEDSTICGAIILSNNYQKCEIKNKVCTQVPKVCSDFDDNLICSSLGTSDDTNKLCVFSNNQCKEQYKTCSLYNTKASPKIKEDCESIKIYDDSTGSFDNLNICQFVDSTCSSRLKVCSDINNEEDCSNFIPSDTEKICIFTNNQCKEQYKTCSLYNQKVTTGKNGPDCLNIKIYDDINHRFDTSSICVFDEGTTTCSSKKRECSEFTTATACNNHIPNDSTNKKCIFIGSTCVEQYKTCEIYDTVDGKTNTICEAILPYYQDQNYLDLYSKCLFNSQNKCERKPKDCSDISDEEICIVHNPDDTKKMCVFANNECKEEYISCSTYNSVSGKSEEGCKSIVNYLSTSNRQIDYTNKCIYESNTCKQVSKKCNDYVEGQPEIYCTGIFISASKKCALVDNQCVEQESSCSYNDGKDKKKCESILLSSPYNKCVLDKDNTCIQKRRSCSEYTGKSQYICENNYVSEDQDKKCLFINNKCTEKYIYCSGYKGNDKNTCESIIPYDSAGLYSLEDNYKCVYGSQGCERKSKGCSEAKDALECLYMVLSDTDKNCAFINNNCVEQYKDCSTYYSKSQTVEQSICESIVLKNDDGYKCVFTLGTSGAKNKCERKPKICSDFKIEPYQYLCNVIQPLEIEKKCIYSNSACSKVNKSCLELGDNSAVTNNICSAASTSDPNNKICSLKSNKAGCEEVNKPPQTTPPKPDNPSNPTNSGNTGNTDNNNGNEIIKLSRFFIIFALLL